MSFIISTLEVTVLELITLGFIILIIGLVVSLFNKAVWLVSIILIYRFVASFVSFEWVQAILGVESHSIYFVVLVALSFLIHYIVVVRLLNELSFVKYTLYLVMLAWVLIYYDFLELFLLKDWLIANNLWGWENIQNALKELFSTPKEDIEVYFKDGLTKMTETMKSLLTKFSSEKV
jgi:hypothetical protein